MNAKVAVVERVGAVLKEGKVKELSDFAYTLDGDMLDQGYILSLPIIFEERHSGRSGQKSN